MRRLEDYNGQLNPEIKLEDFSKDVLVKLLKTYGRLYLAIDGFWFLSVKEKVNNNVALACDLWVWERKCKNEIQRITKLLNIHEKDVISVFKFFQLSPWTWNLQYEMEIRNKNLGILTVVRNIQNVCRLIQPASEQGLFQKDLAEMIGVDEMTVLNWEKGRTKPIKQNLERLEKILSDLPSSDFCSCVNFNGHILACSAFRSSFFRSLPVGL